MEKFFILTDKCGYKRDFIAYRDNLHKVNTFIKDFFKEEGILTAKYSVYDGQLYIVPTDEDLVKFKNVLSKPIGDGLMAFKKNSKIHKSFISKLSDRGIKLIERPSLWYYMGNFYGSFSSSVSLIGDEMYLKLTLSKDKEINEVGFKEIKASEYYLAIEEEEN